MRERAPHLVANTFPFFSVDTLEYLRRGGRIGRITALAGTMLSIKPIITFSDDGQLQSIAKVRGRRQVQDKILELLRARFQSGRRYNLAVANGGAPEEMAEFAARLKAEFPNYEHFGRGSWTPPQSVYIGDGVIGGGIQFLTENSRQCRGSFVFSPPRAAPWSVVEHLAAVLGDQHQILNTHAQLAGQVDARLHGEDHPRFGDGGAGGAVVRRLVAVQARQPACRVKKGRSPRLR